MEEKRNEKIDQMVYQIGNYILIKQFAENEVDVAEALAVLGIVVTRIIRAICNVHGHDSEKMVSEFCNALKSLSEDGQSGTEIIEVVKEIKSGGDVEEIVDRHFDCATPELRQQLIEKITALRDRYGDAK
jgi:hypothetical protein